jgi:hypothetical protein
MESVTVGAGSVPTEDQVLANLEAEAANAPETTEEVLAARKLETGDIREGDVEEISPEDIEEVEEPSEDEVEETPDEDEEPAEDDEEPSEDDEEEVEVTAEDLVFHLTERFAENDGQLDDDDYELAAEMGFSKATVDAYIAGQQAQQELIDYKMNDAAGGKDNLEAMLLWATTGLTAGEIEEYNAIMGDTDVTKAVEGVSKLRSRYEAYYGKAPKTLLGGKPGRAEATTFGSWAEVTKAMADPRYGTKDPAYTAQVAAKLGRSNLV